MKCLCFAPAFFGRVVQKERKPLNTCLSLCFASAGSRRNREGQAAKREAAKREAAKQRQGADTNYARTLMASWLRLCRREHASWPRFLLKQSEAGKKRKEQGSESAKGNGESGEMVR